MSIHEKTSFAETILDSIGGSYHLEQVLGATDFALVIGQGVSFKIPPNNRVSASYIKIEKSFAGLIIKFYIIGKKNGMRTLQCVFDTTVLDMNEIAGVVAEQLGVEL